MLTRLLGVVYMLCRPGVYLLMHKSRRTRVIIYCGEEVLLIKSNFGGQKWGLPGGGIKRRELPEQSAVREVFEELGVQLSPKKLSFLVAQRSGFGQRSWPYVDLVFYEYRLSKKPLRLKLQRFEVSEARWVASKDFEHLEIGEDIMTLLGATGE